jgi:anti-sigma-K factor RskA
MRAADHSRFQDDVGAYLLGALDDTERERFEAHAAVCHVCQDEIDRLRVAADALPRSVEQHDPPAALKQRLMDEVRLEMPANGTPHRAPARRRWRLSMPRVAIAASVAALLLGLGAGLLVAGGSSGGSKTVAASVDARRVGAAHATLIAAKDGPAELRVMGMPQLRRGQVYEVWLKRGNRIEPGALFSVNRNGDGVGAVPGGINGVTAVMVTREPAGGSQQPSEVPVVVAAT